MYEIGILCFFSGNPMFPLFFATSRKKVLGPNEPDMTESWNAPRFYYIFGYFHTLLTTINVRSFVSPLKFHGLCV